MTATIFSRGLLSNVQLQMSFLDSTIRFTNLSKGQTGTIPLNTFVEIQNVSSTCLESKVKANQEKN